MSGRLPARLAGIVVALAGACACPQKEAAVSAPTPPPSSGAPGSSREPSPDGARNDEAAVVIRTPERDVTFRVEIARTDAERSRGLMYRYRLDPDAGMIFLFEEPKPNARDREPMSFWMHNTYIPLDMLFIGPDHRVTGIVENAEPRTDTPRRVGGVSQYVLEINGGLAARLGLRAGQAVQFRGF